MRPSSVVHDLCTSNFVISGNEIINPRNHAQMYEGVARQCHSTLLLTPHSLSYHRLAQYDKTTPPVAILLKFFFVYRFPIFINYANGTILHYQLFYFNITVFMPLCYVRFCLFSH